MPPRDSTSNSRPDAIQEISEPATPENTTPPGPSPRDSALSKMLRMTPSADDGEFASVPQPEENEEVRQSPISDVVVEDMDEEPATEETALLRRRPSSTYSKHDYAAVEDVEGQISPERGRWQKVHEIVPDISAHGQQVLRIAANPKSWDREAIGAAAGKAGAMLSAVFLGTLLNLLDALSYGMILFPLGEDIFSQTAADGISIFYVSTIVAQLTYSLGGSGFKGVVGSEMIEVVPFFHKMAYTIMASTGTENPEAVRATVIMSYAISSVLTGIVFLLLGKYKLGTLVSFLPRSLLTGCIGGVGPFLIITGVEVSARLDGNLDFNLQTLHKLFQADTIALWILPLGLAVLLLGIKHFYDRPFVFPTYFTIIGAIFYIVYAAKPDLSMEDLRQQGWLFEKPEAGVPFYHFYTYYNFKIMDVKAIAKTIPTMVALVFFSILHVPINVPALALAVGGDDIDVNRELMAHGYSNAISGFAGSIQNYLVYANSTLFIRNGGDSRLAGVLLAVATGAVWVAGPGMIAYIPVMIVGTLIYYLGIELLLDALWTPFGTIVWLEYFTIIVIVLVMGFYDFVYGIAAGIFMACLVLVVQTSRKSVIRSEFTGLVAESTVRRHPIQRRFLREVGHQTYVMKLNGYLFFGSIVNLENKVRDLVDAEAFGRRAIRYLVLDFSYITGIDFSAAEAFQRMNRILYSKGVQMILASVVLSSEIGKGLQMVGLFKDPDENDDVPTPKIFEDLNKALEFCENELLTAFNRRSSLLAHQKKAQPQSMVPRPSTPPVTFPSETAFSSPRREYLFQAATTALTEGDALVPSKWQNFSQPLQLILQTFRDLTNKNEDFWHRAVPYFELREYAAGKLLYSRGDEPNGFYLLEEGILRAEYELDQGSYHESIVAGTTCGELPFFSETNRTSTVSAEKDCRTWLLTPEKWRKMQEECPEVARELLKIGMKLSAERMNAVTSYVLITAS
ncbi:hypothetical protein LTR04_001648 [Oleoguttula sp. CCFEE 6159]|nr:hypothetical protein LTR04_001648 [Oleoguttula sp. CCFEE 6159]